MAISCRSKYCLLCSARVTLLLRKFGGHIGIVRSTCLLYSLRFSTCNTNY